MDCVDEKLGIVLQRLDSRCLSKLWLFYRDFFHNDGDCLNFIFSAVQKEPAYNEKELTEKMLETAENDADFNNQLFIPRRMLNCVERMVSAARDMEQIRKGKDIFKIIFLVTCVETLQKLSGNAGKKKDLLFDFFTGYTSALDKEYICNHFFCEEERVSPVTLSFWRFISVINEYRNCATHESEYWDMCFNNGNAENKTPLIISACAQLDQNSMKTKNCYQTTLSYHGFENVFIRTCITFIRNYIAKRENTCINAV